MNLRWLVLDYRTGCHTLFEISHWRVTVDKKNCGPSMIMGDTSFFLHFGLSSFLFSVGNKRTRERFHSSDLCIQSPVASTRMSRPSRERKKKRFFVDREERRISGHAVSEGCLDVKKFHRLTKTFLSYLSSERQFMSSACLLACLCNF